MNSIPTIDNICPTGPEDSSTAATHRTWTLAELKSDVGRGLISCCSIHVHNEERGLCYTLSIQSTLVKDGGGQLVDARTGRIRKFKTLDAAYSAIRQAGVRCDQFLGSAT